MIDEAIDNELEARVRAAFDEMIPKLLAPSTEGLTDGVGPLVVPIHREGSTRSPRGLVAAGLLVAAMVVGLIIVAQRDRPAVSPVDSTPTATTEAIGGTEPAWYRLMRPLIPERFEYASLVVRDPQEIHVVAVDADDGKTLEIGLSVDPQTQQPSTTTVDAFGYWTETPQGWEVLSPSGGLSINISCNIGARGRDFPGPPNFCDMTSTGAFTKAEIRSVVEAFANRFDTSLFQMDIGVTTDHNVNPAAAGAMIAYALPGQTLMSDTEWGHGDRVFDFSAGDDRPDTSIRVLQNLYPVPPVTTQAAYGLYDDAAAFWMFGADGVALRISTTDTLPKSLGGLEQLGATLLASDALVIRPSDPAPSTTIEFIPTTAAPTTAVGTTIVNPTTTLLRTPTGPHLLPNVMPPGFDDVADGYTTETEGAQTDTTRVRAFVGTGDRPAVVVLFSTPASAVEQQVDLGMRDMTTYSAWPSLGLGVVRSSGRYDWFRSGGVTAEDLQRIADHVTDDPSPGTVVEASTEVFTEVTWTQTPQNAHGITWNGPDGQTITLYAEAGHGVDALNAGMTWSIQVLDTPIGRVFASVDATDASFVQVGLVIDGQVINIEARNVALDDVVAMAASIQLADDVDWSRRIVG